MRLRAVVLAAGLGTRLRPLTETEPKPALPVAGVPVAGRTLALLARAGCEAAAVNLHHLGYRLVSALGDKVEGMPLIYSEEQEVQGTLGALWPLREFCAQADPLVVINGDSLCRWPLAQLLKAHRRAGAASTLLMSSRADPEEFGGGVGVDADGSIVTFAAAPAETETKRLVFAGAHVLEPRFLAALEQGPSDFVRNLYTPLLDWGERIAALETRRPWYDLGTPERYRRAVLDHVFRHHPSRRRWLGEGAHVEDEVQLNRSVIESGAIVERNSRLRSTVVLPGARIGRRVALRDCVVGFGARVPDGADIEGQLITPAGDETSGPPAAGSRLGDLVFSPLAA